MGDAEGVLEGRVSDCAAGGTFPADTVREIETRPLGRGTRRYKGMEFLRLTTREDRGKLEGNRGYKTMRDGSGGDHKTKIRYEYEETKPER